MLRAGMVFERGQFRLEFIMRKDQERGQFGEVWLAKDKYGRDVAVKVMRSDRTEPGVFEEHRARFENEARLMAQFEHPNIVSIHYDLDFGAAGVGLVMEYVPYGTLDEFIEAGTRATVAQVIEVVAGAGAALDAVWSQQRMVHRDIKPANLFWEPGRPVKVVDFGVALVLADAGERPAVPFLHPGTPRYKSPEQGRPSSPLDGRSDQYSLAQVLHEMLTGHVYSQGGASLKVARPDLPSGFVAALMRALSAHREERYPDCASFTEALRAASGSSVATARTVMPVQFMSGSRERPWWTWIAAAIVAVTVTAAVVRSPMFTASSDASGARPAPTAAGASLAIALPTAQASAFRTPSPVSPSPEPTRSPVLVAAASLAPVVAPTLAQSAIPAGAVSLGPNVYLESTGVKAGPFNYIRLSFRVVNNSNSTFLLRFAWSDIAVTDEAGRRYTGADESGTRSGVTENIPVPAAETWTSGWRFHTTVHPSAREMTIRFGTVSGRASPVLVYPLSIYDLGINVDGTGVGAGPFSFTTARFRLTNGTRNDFLLRFTWSEIVVTDETGRRYAGIDESGTRTGIENVVVAPGEVWTQGYRFSEPISPSARVLTLRFGTFSGAAGPTLTYSLSQ